MRRLCIAYITFGFLCFAGIANAALFNRGNGLIYDDVLDVTWLKDANLAASNDFGIGGVNGSGGMTWSTSLDWIDAMNTSVYKGYNDWRLPTLSPVDAMAGFDTTVSNDASTDRGFALATTDGTDGGWRDTVTSNPVSEIGHMFYVNLANGAEPVSVNTSFIDGNSGQSIAIDNLQLFWYWYGVAESDDLAWSFNFETGYQDPSLKENFQFHAWAVRSGDVSPVPLPAAAWLFGTVLAGAGVIGWRRKKT